MSKKKDLAWVLHNRHFDKLVFGEELNLFLIDTGVIIDIEDAYHNNGRVMENHPAQILAELETYYPLIITQEVLEEVERHRECLKRSRYEISAPTSLLVHKLFIEFQDCTESQENSNTLSLLELPERLRDMHRYAVFSAYHEMFERDHRKGYKDIMSITDRELVALALDLSQCEYDGQRVGCVNILSPDEHISGTVHMLKHGQGFEKFFKDYNIRAIHTRKDLRSYMAK